MISFLRAFYISCMICLEKDHFKKSYLEYELKKIFDKDKEREYRNKLNNEKN